DGPPDRGKATLNLLAWGCEPIRYTYWSASVTRPDPLPVPHITLPAEHARTAFRSAPLPFPAAPRDAGTPPIDISPYRADGPPSTIGGVGVRALPTERPKRPFTGV